MPRNGSGGTSQPVGSIYPAVPSTLIESAKANVSIADLYSMMADSVAKDGQTVATQRIPFASGISSDTIAELTSATGVTVDGVLLKDGGATFTAGIVAPNLGKLIYGLTYDNGTDATNDLNINVGAAIDATGAYPMVLATALGKQSDVAWAVGGTTTVPVGGLDLIGSAGNNDFYIWLIARSDTGAVDALFSLSSTAPTMPTSYTLKRLIGWFKRAGGTIVAFHTYETEGGGIEMNWDVPTLDVNLANTLTTSRRTDAPKVPLNLSVEAHINANIVDAAGAAYVWICCPDQADAAPNLTGAPGVNLFQSVAAVGAGQQLRIRTSAAGLIAARASVATVDTYTVSTLGFKWARRN